MSCKWATMLAGRLSNSELCANLLVSFRFCEELQTDYKFCENIRNTVGLSLA
jgi:uncharacterized membrane protein